VISTAICWNVWIFASDPFDTELGKLYHFALMSRHVPDFVNPVRAAEGGFVIAGRLAFTRMKRLLEVVKNTGDAADVSLNFSIDGQGIPNVRGRISAELELTCQRCLESMKVPVDLQICLGMVGSEEEAKRLSGQYEPLVIHGEQLLIAEMVEDEILLALPAIPRHEPADCAAENVRQNSLGESDEASANPFAVLAKLKTGR
jgi:uncharacterized protein